LELQCAPTTIEGDTESGILFTISPSGAGAGPLNAIDALVARFHSIAAAFTLAAQRFSRGQHIVYGMVEQRGLA
jgi:hypothetical protein